MKRLTPIAGQLVAVTCLPGDARALETRRLRRANPTDARPVQWHAWAPGYGSAFGDTVEEACDTLAAQWAAAHGNDADPAARPGYISPAERVVLLQGPRRAVRPAVDRFAVAYGPGVVYLPPDAVAAAMVAAALG